MYDASAKPKGGLSLNDCLEKGPSLIPSLVTILIGFRNQAIALSADIEKAFLQIGIDESDRDAIHFLWVADPRKGVGTESASSKICKSFFWPCYSTIHSKYGVKSGGAERWFSGPETKETCRGREVGINLSFL